MEDTTMSCVPPNSNPESATSALVVCIVSLKGKYKITVTNVSCRNRYTNNKKIIKKVYK